MGVWLRLGLVFKKIEEKGKKKKIEIESRRKEKK